MQLALTVRAYVACAEAQSLCRTSPEACHEILHGEGVRVLATALAWCVLDEDMSKGGLLKVVDTDLGCALVDLLTILAGADATKVVGDLKAEAPALIGVCLRAILLDERPQWTVPPCARAASTPCCARRSRLRVARRERERAPAADAARAARRPLPRGTGPGRAGAGRRLQVAPCLERVLRSARCGAEGRAATKAWIYPPKDDERWRAALAANAARAQDDEEFAEAARGAAQASPVDPEPYAMRTLLVELMYKCPQKRTRRLAGDLVRPSRRRPGRVRAAGRDRRGGPVLEGGGRREGGGVFLPRSPLPTRSYQRLGGPFLRRTSSRPGPRGVHPQALVPSAAGPWPAVCRCAVMQLGAP